MRIIGGSAGGTRLRSLPAPELRPMLDRVKESLFNILRRLVPEARVLDLFSGTGSLGLEALSRGAAVCLFVEEDPRFCELIRENAEKCGLQGGAVVLQEDVMDLPRLRPPESFAPADLVFVDPPYAVVDDPNRRAELLGMLEELEGEWVGRNAVLVLHHRPIPCAIWPADRLEETDHRIYGQSQLTFFEWSSPPGD